jgi:hypothetical protein
MWRGVSDGMLSLHYDGRRYRVSRHLGGSYWHVYTLARNTTSQPWNIETQSIYFGGDHCSGAVKATLIQRKSQVEYAYRADGEDVGALNHGNESQVFAQWVVDGSPVELGRGECAKGTTVELTQRIRADVAGPLADTSLLHQFSPQGMNVSYVHQWLKRASIGWYYGAMMPVNNKIGEVVMTAMFLGEQQYNFDDFLGQRSVWSDPVALFAIAGSGYKCLSKSSLRRLISSMRTILVRRLGR